MMAIWWRYMNKLWNLCEFWPMHSLWVWHNGRVVGDDWDIRPGRTPEAQSGGVVASLPGFFTYGWMETGISHAWRCMAREKAFNFLGHSTTPAGHHWQCMGVGKPNSKQSHQSPKITTIGGTNHPQMVSSYWVTHINRFRKDCLLPKLRPTFNDFPLHRLKRQTSKMPRSGFSAGGTERLHLPWRLLVGSYL
jgi:hypothetical protein